MSTNSTCRNYKEIAIPIRPQFHRLPKVMRNREKRGKKQRLSQIPTQKGRERRGREELKGSRK